MIIMNICAKPTIIKEKLFYKNIFSFFVINLCGLFNATSIPVED